MKKLLSLICLLCALHSLFANAEPNQSFNYIDAQLTSHPNLTGIYVLDKGSEALIARAWLADHAQQSIEVQYFIWSNDNIGILASEALLRAADRGVKVRVIVDDLLIKAPDKSLLALAKHPKIDIRIYNPQHSVGTPLHKRLLNVFTDFRGVNQRMHDKTFIVDGKIAITGGRNMAAEYFDYNHQFNFRDRDALLLGKAVKSMQASFENFWSSKLSAPVEDLYDGIGIMQKNVTVNDTEIKQIYQELHDYANSKDNFAAEVHAAIESTPKTFELLAQQMVWDKVEFISDLPGKNKNKFNLGGGGRTTLTLAKLVEGAQTGITIQSPYLVMSDEAIKLFERAIARGVIVRINTNSLASTDNIQAFSGYRNLREQLLKIGVKIFEYKPAPEIQQNLMAGSMIIKDENVLKNPPIFAIHAKTMVIDSNTVYIGTFNFDPRSENLNTEVGIIVNNAKLAGIVEDAINIDMSPTNSWNAATDNPDQYVSLTKRSKVRFLQMTPIKPLL